MLLNYEKKEESQYQKNVSILRVGKTGKLQHCATIELPMVDVLRKLETAQVALKLTTSVSIVLLDFNTIVLKVVEKSDGFEHTTTHDRKNSVTASGVAVDIETFFRDDTNHDVECFETHATLQDFDNGRGAFGGNHE
jgi:hypothetical protein